ncbi:hypothetical protein QBC39DRAFT_74146 [Podospora conica]|nr:hypothetical protein QBC39DRAFT_74146 [Schizothecium conicum]
MAGSSHHPHRPAAVRFFLFFIISLLVSQVVSDCYFPSGNLASGMTECRKDGKGTGVCCFNGDFCIGQICSHDTGRDGKLYRGACTSKTWHKDNACPEICSGRDNLLQTYEELRPCPQKDSYRCGSYQEEDEGCDPKHRIQLKGPLEPYDTVRPSTIPQTSTSAPEITTIPPTDGPPVTPTGSNISPSPTSTDPGAPGATGAPGDVNDGRIIPVAVGIAVGTLITVASSALLFFYIKKKRKERPRRAESPPPHHFTNF